MLFTKEIFNSFSLCNSNNNNNNNNTTKMTH